MAGNQSRGLIAASRTKGWDPTVIPARGDSPEVSIVNFDVDQGNLPQYPVGRLPGGTPDGWPDNWDNGRTDPGPRPGECSFSYPDVGREYGQEHGSDNMRPSTFDNRGRVTPASIPARVEDVRSIFDTPWETPNYSRDATAHKTRNANPYPGMPGADK